MTGTREETYEGVRLISNGAVDDVYDEMVGFDHRCALRRKSLYIYVVRSLIYLQIGGLDLGLCASRGPNIL